MLWKTSSGTSNLSLFNHTHMHTKGILFAAAAFSLFALGDAIFKYLTPHYDTVTLLFWSAVFNMIIMIAASPWLGGLKRTFTGPDTGLHLMRGVILLFQLGLMLYGISQLSLAKAYALIFVAPFITTLLSMLAFRERVSAAKMMAILVGFIGVLIILRPGMVPFDMASGAVIMSAIMFSCSNIFSRFIGRREQTALSWGLITEIPILIVSAIFFSLHSVVPGALDLVLIFVISALSVGALLLLPRAFIYAPPSIAAPFHYVQMLWAILFGYTLFGDRLDLATGIGAAIIIASGIWLLKQDEVKTVQEA